MKALNRREFLRDSALGLAAVAGGSMGSRNLLATPYGKPIGLQLYTLRNELAKDVPGTLRQVAEIGYKEVEIYDFFNRDSVAMRQLLRDRGLTAPSAHYQVGQIKSSWEKQIEYAKAIGLKYMVNAIIFPPERKSLDDYKQLADVFNKAGEQCQKAGIQFAYHNHNFEFKTYDGVVAYDELLRLTDPSLVQFEMDCFWVTRAGHDPVAYFEKYPGRFPLLHIKDLKQGYPATLEDAFQPGPFAPVGQGIIDWKRIFAAAPKGGMKHFFVEQDECDQPPLESIKISFDYLKNLKV
jgi:sugar phosphate isomerase/epimerase